MAKRKWLITFDNPLTKGMADDRLQPLIHDLIAAYERAQLDAVYCLSMVVINGMVHVTWHASAIPERD